MRRMTVLLGSSVGCGLAVVLGTTPVQARLPEPYCCEWVREASPAPVMGFSRVFAVDMYRGFLYYPFGTVVLVVRDQPLRAAPTFWSDGRRLSANRVLLVGLGSALWYGSNPEWRQQKPLLLAAEGFWRLGPGCRELT